MESSKYDGYRKWTIEIAGVPLELLFQFAMLYKNYQWVYQISSMWRQVWYNFLASLTSSAFLSRTWLEELWDVPLALYPLGQSHGSNHFIWIGFSMKLAIQLLGYPHDYGNLHFCFRKCQHDQRMSSRARALASVFFVFRPDLPSFQGHYLGLETGQGWCCTTKTPVIHPYNIYSMYIHIYIYSMYIHIYICILYIIYIYIIYILYIYIIYIYPWLTNDLVSVPGCASSNTGPPAVGCSAGKHLDGDALIQKHCENVVYVCYMCFIGINILNSGYIMLY